MNWKKWMAVPVVITAMLLPASVQAEGMRGAHGHHMHHEKMSAELQSIIDLYAQGELKAQLQQDLATRESLMQQMHEKMKTPAGQARMEERRKQMQEKMAAHREQMEQIRKRVQEGKITIEQAREEFSKVVGEPHEGHLVYRELEAAAAKKDKGAAVAALEKLHRHLQEENTRLKKELAAIR